MCTAIHTVPKKCRDKNVVLYFYQMFIPGCSLKNLFYHNSWLTSECVVCVDCGLNDRITLFYCRNLEFWNWTISVRLDHDVLQGCSPHAFWERQSTCLHHTHASSTYQRIQINSLFGRISVSALDTRRREGGCIEKLSSLPFSAGGGSHRDVLQEHESLSTSKQKKSPYSSPAPQESIRTIQHVYSSCHQLGLVIYGNTNNIFPQPFDDALYISIFMNLQRNDHLFDNFNSHCAHFFKSKIQ